MEIAIYPVNKTTAVKGCTNNTKRLASDKASSNAALIAGPCFRYFASRYKLKPVANVEGKAENATTPVR